MQDPTVDTEWNDVLRKHGIIPNKDKAITEEQFLSLANETIDNYIEKKTDANNSIENYTLDQLNEAEDSIEETQLEQIRKKRREELKSLKATHKFGQVTEITASNYEEEVNRAGEDVWVVLHLYQSYVDKCKLINDALNQLAPKFAHIKFLKGVATECIKDYPDKNVPTIFIFKNTALFDGFVGDYQFAAYTYKNAASCLEWLLAGAGVIKSDVTQNPTEQRKHKKTQISSSIFGAGGSRRNYNNNEDATSSDDGGGGGDYSN